MRLVFLGTPDIACPSLRALVEAGFTVAAVVTQPDRPAGRGQRLNRCPVARLADELGLPILQPPRIKDAVTELVLLQPQALAVVAFGQILPPAVLALAPLGAINLHTSLLPALRGAAPIQRAIMQGLKKTGVSTMFLDAGMDTGDIILQERTPILAEDTAGSLGERLGELGAALLARTLAQVAAGEAPRRPQEDALATYAPLLSKAEGQVDWARPARELDWLVRGADPWPGAYTLLAGQPLKLFAPTLVLDIDHGAAPGTILPSPAQAQGLLTVASGQGALGLAAVQAAGKKRLPAGEFLRGARLGPGARLGA